MIRIKKEDVLVEPKDIVPTSNKFRVIGAFNPGAERLPDGDVVLYVRVAEDLIEKETKTHYMVPRCAGDKTCLMKFDKFKKKDVKAKSDVDILFEDGTKRLFFISHLRRVILDKSGFKIKSIDQVPSFSGIKSNGELGIEDPRIVKLGDRYAMTYVSLSLQGNVSVSLALSEDGIHWNRKGTIFSEQNKDVVLFPHMVRGNYYILNRPEGGFEFTPPHIWMATSKDLINWGKNKPLRLAKKGHWDYERVGGGAPPIRTDEGWLMLYHGVIDHKNTAVKDSNSSIINTTSTYEVGAALLDLKNPRKVLAKADKPIIGPRQKYEREGFVNNVVFPTGLLRDKDERNVLIYCGGADKVTAVKRVALKEILNRLESVKKS